jgi:hypothetical protein
MPSKICPINSHAASAGHETNSSYSCKRGGCITQMSYLWYYLAVAKGLRISENSVKAKFGLALAQPAQNRRRGWRSPTASGRR